ncbi:MAG: metallophosphoesterase family protein [Bacteroidales bacterium]|jgi:serine/threonine protein phosphatase 1|nr:metallophosphoesterase family protein [Bacteroidales bacterium]
MKHDRIFAIGDIHGCFDTLQTLIEEKIKPTKNDLLVFLGDYIDKGSKSKQVIDYIIELRNQGFEVVTLMGNHEILLLEAHTNKTRMSVWLEIGGYETMRSLGIKSLHHINPVYLDFFNQLEYFYEYDGFLFVHAGFNDKNPDPFEDKSVMAWICKKKYKNPLLADKIIVHGHCPVSVTSCNKRIRKNKKVIDIDTGCVYTYKENYGVLTALEVKTMEIFSAESTQ